MSLSTAPSIGTRLRGRWLSGIRLIAVVLALLMLGVGFISYLAYLPAVSQVCTLSDTQCQRQLQFTTAELENFRDSPVSFNFAVIFRYAILAGATGLSCVLGLFIMARKSDDWMALFVGLFLISFGLSNGGPTSAFLRLYPFLAPLMQSLRVVQSSLLILFFILFPNGRVEPRWMRWAGPLVCAFYIGINLVPNMIEIASQPGFLSVLIIGSSIGTFVILMVGQVSRYRHYSNPSERQQTRWVVFGVVLYIATQLATVFFVVPLQSPENRWLFFFFGTLGFNASQAILPLAIGFAILRSRLFDIDVLIRRTLQYSLLSGLLALVYFGLIIILQGVFTAVSGQQSAVATVLSTLAIAALFLPLRRRVQNFIDKRFFRQKYDAAQVIADFAATCRDETDLDTLTTRLVEVARETMQPEGVMLWLKDSSANPGPIYGGHVERVGS